MNKKLFIIFLFFSSLKILAQEKISIAFIPISYDETMISKADAQTIQQSVLNKFVTARKFSVVDREQLDELENEKNLQRTESFMDSEPNVTDGVSLGASYLISTSILSLRHSEIRRGWESMLQLQIKVLDISTGQILATENISSEFIEPSNLILKARKEYLSKDELKVISDKEDRLEEIQSHKEDAFIMALQRLELNIQKFTGKNFPVALEIINWNEKAKGQFIINGGHKIGLYPGQMLDIQEVTEVTIADKTIERNKKIAIATVIRVDDDNFSEAKVIYTEKAFKSAIKNESKLRVLTQ
ncbi:hypothetical protein SCB49_04790 [unidentified eubacterium SCB49]|nr:hypothetical protein SCB49_04790 [unidentified eubacterium SCB49]